MKLALWFAAVGVAVAQTQGVVVDAVTGAPLPGAYVSVRANGTVARTDAAGHFTVETGLMQVVRAGYVQAMNVQPNPAGGEVTIRLTPGAVVAGKIIDQDGFPDSGANVELLQYRINNGERHLYQLVNAPPVRSNDLGEYRIGGLSAGRYYLRVSGGSANNWDRRYVTQYFGGTVEPKAENRIEVKTGEVRDKTNITLLRFEGVTVSGRIVGLSQELGANGRPMLRLADMESAAPGLFASALHPDGSFTITHVPPGKYKLTSQSGAFGEAGSLQGEVHLEVGANDLTGLTLSLHTIKAIDIAGSFVLAGGGTPGPMKITLSGNGRVNAHSEADGSFVLPGVLPGHYQLQVSRDVPLHERTMDPLPVLVMQAAMLGDQEVVRAGFDVDSEPVGPLRITLGPAVLTNGKVLDVTGQPVSGVTVFLMSNKDEWAGATRNDGTFHSMVRIPGTYRTYLITDPSQRTDADYLDAHQNDFPAVTLTAGENRPIMLVKK